VGFASLKEYDPVRKEGRATRQTQSPVKPERGWTPASPQDSGPLLSEMAHEVDLESFKELERDIILRVLYRDQTVQSTEEERVR
jgi:hypothetical protein